jgi:hypothetical protein
MRPSLPPIKADVWGYFRGIAPVCQRVDEQLGLFKYCDFSLLGFFPFSMSQNASHNGLGST